MWQRFTERARRVVFFAQEEAGRLGQNYVSTEHLVLGLVRESDSIAGRILDRMNVSLARIRSDVERQVARGDGRLGQDMQLTPRAKRVIDLAYDEARQLKNEYIGTEHLLLGLIREGEGLAGRVLSKRGVDLERTRAIVMQLQEADSEIATRQARPLQWSKEVLLAQIQRSVQALFDREPAMAKMSPGELLYALTGRADDRSGGATEQADVIAVGDLGRLRGTDNREAVEIAATEAALKELVAVVRARDHYGYRALIASGDVFLAPAGTEVKVLRRDVRFLLDGNTAVYHVRVRSGTQEGRAGWIAANEIEPAGADATPFPPPVATDGNGG